VLRAPAPPASVAVPPVPRPAAPRRARIVVLDPGHGGPDPGAIGQAGQLEKRIVLEVVRRLKERLDATGRYQVLMTRNSDIYIPLRERVALARAANADLFVSLHADWIDRSQVRGASVYTLSEGASDSEAQELAARENRADIIAGVDLSAESDEVTTILIDLAQRETLNHAIRFARTLVPELASAGQLLDRTHRFAGFRVLKAPDVPSVLVELGYLSNREDERMLASAAGQARLAEALARAVNAFFAAGQS
jgi:N-acetylmuramoyl-L-alanine amidase